MTITTLAIDINDLLENSKDTFRNINPDILSSLGQWPECTEIYILYSTTNTLTETIIRIEANNSQYYLEMDTILSVLNNHDFFKNRKPLFVALDQIDEVDLKEKHASTVFISHNQIRNQEAKQLDCQLFYRPAVLGELNFKDANNMIEKIKKMRNEELLMFMLDFDDTIVHFRNGIAYLNTHLLDHLAKFILTRGTTQNIETRILSARLRDACIKKITNLACAVPLLEDSLPIFFDALKKRITVLATAEQKAKIDSGEFDLSTLTVLPQHRYCLNEMPVFTEYKTAEGEVSYTAINHNLTEAENLIAVEKHCALLKQQGKEATVFFHSLIHTDARCKASFFKEFLLPLLNNLGLLFQIFFLDDSLDQITTVKTEVNDARISVGKIHRNDKGTVELTHAPPPFSPLEKIQVPCFQAPVTASTAPPAKHLSRNRQQPQQPIPVSNNGLFSARQLVRHQEMAPQESLLSANNT